MAKGASNTAASKASARAGKGTRSSAGGNGEGVKEEEPKSTPGDQQRHPSASIEDAIELAVRCHRGQVDKYRQPYILHVFGVAARCRSVEEKIVAFLHDTVEDTHVTFDDLREIGFSERIIAAVECLTRRKGESYDAFVDRIIPNALARAVKLADLEDNMDVRRSNRPMKEKDAERMEKYRLAWQKITTIHSGGEPVVQKKRATRR